MNEDLFGFRGGPTYLGAGKAELFQAALDQPMNAGATIWDQTKGGVLESFGLGTALKDFATPQGNTETSYTAPLTDMALVPIPGVTGLLREGYQALTNKDQPSLSEDQYKASPYYRAEIPYDPGMTEQRAAALADWYDARKTREYFATKRPWTSFIAGLAGQAIDPINYIEIAGPLVKLAAIGKFGRVAGTALSSSLDAASNTAVASLLTAGQRAKFGDDVSWEATVSQIATAALIGGAFGTIAGGLGARSDAKLRDLNAGIDSTFLREFQASEIGRLSTLKTTQEARVALNEAIGSVVRGEDVSLSPNATQPMARLAGEVDRSWGKSIGEALPPSAQDVAAAHMRRSQAAQEFNAATASKDEARIAAARQAFLDSMRELRRVDPQQYSHYAGLPGNKAIFPELKEIGAEPIARSQTVVTPTGLRVGVQSEIVDAKSLVRASGALQPRDRSRAASDAQIADMAANLDPGRLLFSPEADRGAPIVGPDNVIESGNGRIAAIERAAEVHPERFAAYKQALRDAGYQVPDEGVPVLISRRTSPLTDEQRTQFVGDANTSAIARMSATETAISDVRAMTSNVLDNYVPGDITSAGNRAFVGSFIRNLPANERLSLIDAQGHLNSDGIRRIENALIAAAYGDTDVVAKFAETPDANVKSIMGAMSDAAGEWAAMRKEIAQGLIDADRDVTANLTDALRFLARARDKAVSEKRPVATVIKEELGQIDMLAGEIDPRTKAFVQAFYKSDSFTQANGRDIIGEHLGNIVRAARELGRPQLFGDAANVPPSEMIANAAPQARQGDLLGAGSAGEGIGGNRQEVAAAEGNRPANPQGAGKELSPEDFYRPPDRSFDELYAVAPKLQAELDGIGKTIADEVGVEYKTKGTPKERATAEEKVGRKGYASPAHVTDIMRGGFIAGTPDKADAVIARLSEHYDVLDEGWMTTSSGYLDRKALIRFQDGSIGEVQFWEPNLYRSRKSGGHRLYKEMVQHEPGSPEYVALQAKQQALYSDALDASGPAWSRIGGDSSPKLLNRSRQAGSDITPAVFQTSEKSAFTHEELGLSMARASDLPSTAGRPSQFANVMRPNIGENGASINTARPKPDPIPEGLKEATARVAKMDSPRTIAEQFGIDLASGDFPELADIEQMRAMGRLTSEDEAAMAAADETMSAAEAYGNAMKAALFCEA